MEIKKLAALVAGTIENESTADITGLSGIETAKKGDLTFAIDESRLTIAEKSDASCILTTLTIRKSSKPLIRVANPKLAFLFIYNALQKNRTVEPFVHPTAAVAKTAVIGKNVHIGACAVIEEDVVIGDNVYIDGNVTIKKDCAVGNFCRLYPNVTLYEGTILKENIMLHSGVVIGADGFGYVKENDVIHKFPQLGKVIIESHVEIGANTTVDRGALSDTIIGAGTKIDNLCQIAHNVKIGKNVIMAGQSGISGSTTIKDGVMIGGQVGIADNLTIGENVIIAAKSGIIGDVEPGAIIWGIPARPIGQTKKQLAAVSWLGKNFKSVSRLIHKEQQTT